MFPPSRVPTLGILVNIAPLLAIRVSGRSPGVGEVPREWFAALETVGPENVVIEGVMRDSTLSLMIREPLSLESPAGGLAGGQIGLISDTVFPGGWGAKPGRPPTAGWWPEAIQLLDGPPLAYPADPDPFPVLAFFVAIEPSFPGPRNLLLARATFPIPASPSAPPRIWPTPDGQCGYQISEETQFQQVTCITLNCPHSCSGSEMTLDGGRSGVLCRCL